MVCTQHVHVNAVDVHYYSHVHRIHMYMCIYTYSVHVPAPPHHLSTSPPVHTSVAFLVQFYKMGPFSVDKIVSAY